MPDGSSDHTEPRFVLDLDDLADVDELELPEVKPPEPTSALALALGSELRPRVVPQGVPSELDLALMAYLLDIDVPAEPPGPPAASADDHLDESPTPRFRSR